MLKVYGMIAFQFDIHPMLMTIEVDMQHKRKIGNAVSYGLCGIFHIFIIHELICVKKLILQQFLVLIFLLSNMYSSSNHNYNVSI